MSATTKQRWGLTLAIVGALGGLSGIGAILTSTLILPYRMSAAETAIRELQTKRETDHDNLIRIEDRVMSIQQRLGIPTNALEQLSHNP